MAERRKPMQGSVENFFKVLDEAKRTYANLNFELTFKKYYRMLVEVDGKTVFDIKGNETNILFDNAATKLLNFLRS